MADPAYAFQVAVAATLLADAAVVALVGQNVLSPLNATGVAYPLVEIGNDQVQRGADDQCYEILAQIDVWAEQRLQTKQIGAAVVAVLAPDFGEPALDISGHRVLSAVFHASKYLIEGDPTEPEQRISHGVLQFRFQTVPTNA